MYARLYNCKPAICTQDLLAKHKYREGIARRIASEPFVLEHNPNRTSHEWNVGKTDRLGIEPTYEIALENLRYLKKQEQEQKANVVESKYNHAKFSIYKR